MYPTSDQAVAGKTCRERSAGQDQPRGAAESTVELAIRPPVPVTVFLSA